MENDAARLYQEFLAAHCEGVSVFWLKACSRAISSERTSFTILCLCSSAFPSKRGDTITAESRWPQSLEHDVSVTSCTTCTEHSHTIGIRCPVYHTRGTWYKVCTRVR